MKKIVFVLALGMASMAGSCRDFYVIEAQSFPVLVHIESDGPNAADAVTSVEANMDGGAFVSYPPTVLPVCNCVKSPTFTINDSNPHTFNVRFVNVWGAGPVAVIGGQAKLPGKPTSNAVKPGS